MIQMFLNTFFALRGNGFKMKETYILMQEDILYIISN
jgi:hypothetical protein